MSRLLKRILVGTSLTGFLLAIAGFIIGSHVSVNNMEKKIGGMRDEYSRHIQMMIEDAEAVRASKLFNSATRERNALPLVSKHVAWDLNARSAEKEVPGSTLLLRQYANWTSDAEIFKRMIADPKLHTFDTAWIRELGQFDHLSLTQSMNIAKSLNLVPQLSSVHRISLHASMATLDVTDYSNQVLIHLLKTHAKSNGEKRAALKELAHAASLLQSVPLLTAQMAAIGLIRREIAVSEKFRIPARIGLTMELTDRMKRLAFAWPSVVLYLEFDSNPATNPFWKLQPLMTPETLACGGAETIGPNVMFSDFLEPQWPFEPSFTERLRKSRELSSTLLKECGLNAYLVFTEARNKDLPEVEPSSEWLDAPGSGIYHRLPYFRRIVAAILTTVAVPNYMRLYDEKTN